MQVQLRVLLGDLRAYQLTFVHMEDQAYRSERSMSQYVHLRCQLTLNRARGMINPSYNQNEF